MMRYLPILIALLIAAPAWGAGWPASDVLYSNDDTVEGERDVHQEFNFSALPTCDVDAAGVTVYVNNSSATTACDPDGDAYSLCGCDGADWLPVNTDSGGGDDCTVDCAFTGSTTTEDLEVGGVFDWGSATTVDGNDQTPDVSGGNLYSLQGYATETPITNFDSGSLGQSIFLKNTNVADVTFTCGGFLICGTEPLVTEVGDVTEWLLL
jgi:hypothetical protein